MGFAESTDTILNWTELNWDRTGCGMPTDTIPDTTLLPPEWFCIRTGGVMSRFNVSWIVWAKVTRRHPRTLTFGEKWEPKQNRTEAPPVHTAPYRWAKPVHRTGMGGGGGGILVYRQLYRPLRSTTLWPSDSVRRSIECLQRTHQIRYTGQDDCNVLSDSSNRMSATYCSDSVHLMSTTYFSDSVHLMPAKYFSDSVHLMSATHFPDSVHRMSATYNLSDSICRFTGCLQHTYQIQYTGHVYSLLLWFSSSGFRNRRIRFSTPVPWMSTSTTYTSTT